MIRPLILFLVSVERETPNGLRYLRWVGVVSPSDADNAEACKMLIEAAESPASGARFVSLRFRECGFLQHSQTLCVSHRPSMMGF